MDGNNEHYSMNGFSPSRAVSFNLSIVNPGMSGQGYILNPVSPSVVTYPYITLPAQNGGDMLNMPVPVLQSIVISNDEPHNNSILIKPVPIENNNGFIKADKAEPEAADALAMAAVIRKPCPLEMSIKAANIDIDENDVEAEQMMIMQCGAVCTMPLQPQSTQNCQATELENVVETRPTLLVEVTKALLTDEQDLAVEEQQLGEVSGPVHENLACDMIQDTATTPSQTIHENLACDMIQDTATAPSQTIHESLICEVEEANESGEEEEGEEGEEEEKEEEEDTPQENSPSSEEMDRIPLSMVMKLRKVKDTTTGAAEEEDDEEAARKRPKRRTSKPNHMEEFSVEWPDSDQGEGSPGVMVSDKPKKFVKVHSCCTVKECYKKINVKDQKLAYGNFNGLESREKQDSYLANCIEQAEAERSEGVGEEQADEGRGISSNIQLEIQNESNGNETLCTEIQNAINESLKDCLANQQQQPEQEEDCEKETWHYYIVVERCRRRVCLTFLTRLFRIPKKRIRALQTQIRAGAGPAVWCEEDSLPVPAPDWTVAAADYLATLARLECAQCNSNPRHTILAPPLNSKQALFESFRQFYRSAYLLDPAVKFQAYSRFLTRDWKGCSFLPQKSDSCADCNAVGTADRRAEKKRRQESGKPDLTKKKSRSRKKVPAGSESDDDAPLIKRKQLKMTISLKNIKKESRSKVTKGRDVWSLMLLHLEGMSYKTSRACLTRKKHRYLSPDTYTTRSLYDDYRRYFLKETNSELGLGFAMYEKYFQRNCGYSIAALDDQEQKCPRCEAEPPPPAKPPRAKPVKVSKPVKSVKTVKAVKGAKAAKGQTKKKNKPPVISL